VIQGEGIKLILDHLVMVQPVKHPPITKMTQVSFAVAVICKVVI